MSKYICGNCVPYVKCCCIEAKCSINLVWILSGNSTVCQLSLLHTLAILYCRLTNIQYITCYTTWWQFTIDIISLAVWSSVHYMLCSTVTLQLNTSILILWRCLPLRSHSYLQNSRAISFHVTLYNKISNTGEWLYLKGKSTINRPVVEGICRMPSD